MSSPINPKQWLDEYFARYRRALFEQDVSREIIAFKELCLATHARKGKLIFAGNGASASISSHAATDFTKQGGIPAICFNEANLITAFANDYGYDNWLERAVSFYASPGDTVVLISSSGRSANVIAAASSAKKSGLTVVTFTGFQDDNPLKQLGDLNFWVDSKAYNIIENTHSIWITAAIDLLIGKAEYPTSAPQTATKPA